MSAWIALVRRCVLTGAMLGGRCVCRITRERHREVTGRGYDQDVLDTCISISKSKFIGRKGGDCLWVGLLNRESSALQGFKSSREEPRKGKALGR